MALGKGQLVGDAYVRIHADSSAIDRELRREFNARKSGRQKAKDFTDGFTAEVEQGSKGKLERARQSLIAGAVGGDEEWDRQFRKSGLSVDRFVKSVEDRFATLGGRKSLKGVESIRTALDDLGKWAEGARVAEQVERVDKAIRNQNKALDTYRDNIRASETSSKRMEKAILDQDRAWQTYTNNLDPVLARSHDLQVSFDKQNKALATYGENLKATRDAERRSAESSKRMEKAVLNQDRAFQSYSDNIGKKLPGRLRRLADFFNHDKSLERYAQRVDGTIPKALVRLNKHLDSSGDHMTRFTSIVGKVFGKGSRNNFLNFTGSVAQGLATIGTKLSRAGLRVFGFGATFADILGRGALDVAKGFGTLFGGGGAGGITSALSEMGKGIGDLATQVGSTLVSALAAAVPAMAALAAATVIVSAVIFPLIALVANLAGALFVLAAQVSVGIAGALLALAPAALAAAGGFAVLVLSITSIRNASGKAKEDLKPFTDAWNNLLKTFKGKPLEQFARSLGNLAPIMNKVLTPLVVGFSGALSIITDTFAALFTGPRIQPALKDFLTTLPRILTNFGQGLAEMSAGIVQFLQPILPFAERLSQKFEELMTTFDDWASSAEGKNAIRDFMKSAWEAASDLWDIIVLVVQALSGLIGLATGADSKDDGSTVLDSIKGSLQTFVDWINSPEGAQAIQQFFTNALSTASQFGDSIGEIAQAMSEVDWVKATNEANDLVEALGKISGAITIFLASFGTQSSFLVTLITTFGDTFRGVYNGIIGPVLSAILGGFAGIMNAISLLLHVLAKVPGMGFLESVADELDTAIAGVVKLSDQIRSIPDGSSNINVTVSGEGARLLRAGSTNTIAQRRLKTIFGAAGGILDGPTFIRNNVVAGEAGREAVVPLDRPLSQVSPSVRALSAFAQSLGLGKMARGGLVSGSGSSVVVEAGAIQVITPYADPQNVAESVLDRLAAQVRV